MRVDISLSSSSMHEHQCIVNSLRQIADMVPSDSVEEPDVPVAAFLSDGFDLLSAALTHFDVLSAAGVSDTRLKVLERRLVALRSAEAIYSLDLISERSTVKNPYIPNGQVGAGKARNREIRNRLYTLAKESVAMIQTMAAAAFESDLGEQRRREFHISETPAPAHRESVLYSSRRRS